MEIRAIKEKEQKLRLDLQELMNENQKFQHRQQATDAEIRALKEEEQKLKL